MSLFKISETTVNDVIEGMRAGDTGYVEDFFAARPDWCDNETMTTSQADEQQQASVHDVSREVK